MFENNQVNICGKIVEELKFAYQISREGVYSTKIQVERLSNSFDVIPVLISEKLINVKEYYVGKTVQIKGQFHSRNYHKENKSHLLLYIFAEEIFLEQNQNQENQIFLDGFICKQSAYRRTPLGREIADLLLAVNRPYGKSDYIPCICWGRNAKFAEKFKVGEHIQIWGRIQSREYIKRINKTETEKRIAYEVSINKLKME